MVLESSAIVKNPMVVSEQDLPGLQIELHAEFVAAEQALQDVEGSLLVSG